jgi:hypothetical protein
MRGLLPVLVGLSALASGTGAHGADRPGPALLVLFAGDRDDPLAAAVRGELDRIAAAERLSLVDLSPPAAAPPQAARLLAGAIDAYERFAFDSALVQLDAAIAEVLETGGEGLGPEQLADLFLHRAMVRTQRGASGEAWNDLLQFAVLQPAAQLDPLRFAPGVREAFERARAAVASAPVSQLVVDAPADCRVMVDGRAVSAQLALPLPRGQHVLRIRCPGGATHAAAVLLHEDRQVVAPLLRPPAGPALGELLELASRHGAQRLVYALVTRAGAAAPVLSVRVVEVATRRLRRAELRTLQASSAPAAARSALRGVLAPQPAAHPARGGAAVAAWYRRPWVWGLAGMLLGAGIALPLAIDGEPAAGFDVRLERPR